MKVSKTFIAAEPVLVIADPRFIIDADVDWSDIVLFNSDRFFGALAGQGGVTFLDKKR